MNEKCKLKDKRIVFLIKENERIINTSDAKIEEQHKEIEKKNNKIARLERELRKLKEMQEEDNEMKNEEQTKEAPNKDKEEKKKETIDKKESTVKKEDDILSKNKKLDETNKELYHLFIEFKKKGFVSAQDYSNNILKELDDMTVYDSIKIEFSHKICDALSITEEKDKEVILAYVNKFFADVPILNELKQKQIDYFTNVFGRKLIDNEQLKEKISSIGEEKLKEIFEKYDKDKKGMLTFEVMKQVIAELNLGEVEIETLLLAKEENKFNQMNYGKLIELIKEKKEENKAIEEVNDEKKEQNNKEEKPQENNQDIKVNEEEKKEENKTDKMNEEHKEETKVDDKIGRASCRERV